MDIKEFIRIFKHRLGPSKIELIEMLSQIHGNFEIEEIFLSNANQPNPLENYIVKFKWEDFASRGEIKIRV